ncbi:hypothetical protein ANO11243_079420 [Dothideomycetidae sp. 11243]|nr:hypothetical protein ANO11243_079420 [fungal sp. No.11243]
MAGKKGSDNTKKAAGNAKKAEAAAGKKAAEDRQKEAAESTKWTQGSKDTSKAEQAAAKQAEAARKKAEKAALLAEEEASLPSKGSGKASAAPKKSRGLDLSGLDLPSSKKEMAALNASGIDNALDALSLTAGGAAAADKVDRHPERRFKAAFAAFEERRLEEMKDEKGLRRDQKIAQIRKEFEKHPDNPFNQVHGLYNSSKGEVAQIKAEERDKVEKRLAV